MAADRRAFIGGLEDTAERAARAAGGFEDHYFALAGLTLRMRFGGDALVPALTPALAHAQVAAVAEPDLTVRIWDSTTTATTMPPPPWGSDDYREHGAIRGFFDDELKATFHWASHSLSVLQPRLGKAFYWVKRPEDLSFFEQAAPMRSMLRCWLADNGRQLLHAAAVAGSGACVLLAGPSGAGKSSAALACLCSGLGHLADDYCILEPTHPATIHALYSTAKASSDTLERLGLPSSMVANRHREEPVKALLHLQEQVPAKLVARARLGAIAVPRISGERGSRIVPASRAAALRALAPSTLLQVPGTDRHTLADLAAAVRSVPCFRLDVGTDPARTAEVLEPLLER